MSFTKNQKITVIGVGYVGLVTAVCFAHMGYNVTCFDTDIDKINMLKRGISPIYEPELEDLILCNQEKLIYTQNAKEAINGADFIFVGVGTPENLDGSANLSFILDAFESISQYASNDCIIVIKSTVPVGTNETMRKFLSDNLKKKIYFDIVSNPEFLSQGTAVRDTLCAERIIIGVSNSETRKYMEMLYSPFQRPIIFMSIKSAELVKYACNAFLATKISFINEISNLCDAVGANIDDIKIGMSLDSRIGSKFLNAGIGFGGSCFSKDSKALLDFASRNDVNLEIVQSTLKANEKQRFVLLTKLQRDFPNLEGKKIGVLGVTYKPNTNDLRDAPSINIINFLLSKKSCVSAYDPVGLKNLQTIFHQNINYYNNPRQLIADNDILIILTEWQQIINLENNLFLNKWVYDGRNCMSSEIKKFATVVRYIGK